MLIQQTENVQAARQVRFTSLREVVKLEPILKDYIHEAIEVEKAGLKVNYKKAAEFNMPEEFIDKLEGVPGLQDAFEALTPGRQRAYLLYFSAPKQSKTRESQDRKIYAANSGWKRIKRSVNAMRKYQIRKNQFA